MEDFFYKRNKSKDYHKMTNLQIEPYKNKLALIWFIEYLITLGLVMIPTGISSSEGTISMSGGAFGLFLTGAFMFSYIMICDKVLFGYEPNLKDLFSEFKFYGRSLGLYLLTELYITLWSFLFIIPGIIKAYSYSMAPYIALYNPNLSVSQCITASRQLMKGNKGRLFCLHMSYLGWIILCFLTLGVLTFWVAPKIEYAQYLFYLDISGNGKKLDNIKTEIYD